MTVKLDDLPPEVLFQILLWVPPASIPTIQQVCRKFNNLSEPLLWRYHCHEQFRYWSPHHDIQRKFAQDAASVDWKDIFRNRHIADVTISSELESILSSQTRRLEKSEKIFAYGYDAKDTLLRHLHCSDDAEDVLARRYYSDALLGGVHRATAINEWAKLKNGQSVPLERALAAFDQFVLHDREGDLHEVSARLDEVAQSIRDEFPELSENTPRRKAELIAGYLVRSKLTGVAEDSQYHNLQNNFIGLALNSSHAALPLISVGIFCSVAERLGLVAVPCGFPFHVYAIVIAPDDQGLDEAPPTDQSPPQLMYMDPFRSDREVPRSDLEAQLRTMGVPPDEHETQLGVSSVAEMVRRTARNIIGSVQATRHVHEGSNESNEAQYPESDGALYAAVWALMLVPDDNAALFPHARYLPYIMDYLEKQSFFDVRLVEMYMLPLFEGSQQLQQLREAIHVIRVGDSVPKPVYCRPVGSKRIPFRVGQVFRHKRYHYQGVITGWDIECAAGEAWMAQMGVDRLPRGRHQSFYHVLVEDNSVRYVAEENIADTNIDAGSSLMALAGRHFKRWDAASKTFVSNIRDEYPDD